MLYSYRVLLQFVRQYTNTSIRIGTGTVFSDRPKGVRPKSSRRVRKSASGPDGVSLNARRDDELARGRTEQRARYQEAVKHAKNSHPTAVVPTGYDGADVIAERAHTRQSRYEQTDGNNGLAKLNRSYVCALRGQSL